MDKDPVTIRCDGRTLTCRPDTTVAVALWEQGIRTLSHSPKYGSPRGVTCARGHCTACLMRVDGVPNVRTCELPVREGMDIRRQDSGAAYGPLMQKIMAAGSSLLPVGFYYRWFTRPPFVSRGFLRAIRPLTGIGRLPDTAGPARSLPPAPAAGSLAESPDPARDLGHFDVVVVGGGPSGLAVARQSSGSVLIVDDHAPPGGQRAAALLAVARDPAAGLDHFPCLRQAKTRLDTARAGLTALESAEHPRVRFEGRVRAVAGYAPDHLLLRRDQDLLTARFRRFVWAAGALDTLGLFPGNDTPGVMGPRALYRLVARDGLDVQDRQVLVVGSGLDFWLSAALLAVRRARLTLVVTQAGQEAEISAAMDRKWSVHAGLTLASVKSVAGGRRLQAAFIAKNPGSGPLASGLKVQADLKVQTDLAVICGRGKPAYDIPYQVGCDLRLQPDLGGFVPAGAADGFFQGVLPSGAAITVLGEAAGGLPGMPGSPVPEVDAG